MRKIVYFSVLASIIAIGLFFYVQRISAQTPAPTPAAPIPMQSEAGQINPNNPDALTSFTISNPYCYQPDPTLDQCSLNFRFIQAVDNQSAAPYMTWLSITVSGKKRFNATAFFEGTITYSYDMVPNGIIVPCGLPNAGGAGDQYGNVFGVTVQPLDSSRNPMSTDIANVTCPAFAP